MLVEYFRYALKETDRFVPLKKEMDFVENYVSIQKIRFPGAFTSVYGAPTSSSYTSSSMGTGEDGILAIGGYTVYTYGDETGYEYIVDIG